MNLIFLENTKFRKQYLCEEWKFEMKKLVIVEIFSQLKIKREKCFTFFFFLFSFIESASQWGKFHINLVSLFLVAILGIRKGCK
jgi:hypothetical protein